MPGHELSGRSFWSTAVHEKGVPRHLVARTRIGISFGQNGRFHAGTGGNRIDGWVTFLPDQLLVRAAITTEIAFEKPGIAEQEDWLVGFLCANPFYTWTGGANGTRLRLRVQDTVIDLALREDIAPDPELVGTRWTLFDFFDTPSGMPRERVRFVRGWTHSALTFDGHRITGQVGTVRFNGPARFDDRRIEIGPLDVDHRPTSEEHRVLTALTGTMTTEIDGNRLLLISRLGAAFVLRAGDQDPAPPEQ